VTAAVMHNDTPSTPFTSIITHNLVEVTGLTVNWMTGYHAVRCMTKSG